ncbi:uncharacterized protein LOC109720136 isoform X2 [Ananas comosus]|uniref:Uncharacterized protein LOC109720136 isoform X2 n=1 Tax=Ananas comosus TaxID=4615 RepID=A0A6P5G9V6_ANACO|nr:uncharacterized protein LOC109720136 isoform X2 [Ananas comosus]
MTSTTKLNMKLLVDTKANKVLFAEAGKDVVDFLFSLLALPVGTIIKLMTKESMFGSVGNIHQSLERLECTYLLSNQTKVDLLNPKVLVPSFSANGVFLLSTSASSSSMHTNKRYYRCSNSYYSNCGKNYVTDVSGTTCPLCKQSMTKEVQYVEPNSRGAVKVENNNGENGLGVVKGVVTYTIMDDLTITPMSTISSITLLNTCNVKDLSVLQEKNVKLGMEELLKASLQSKTVLTDLFLTKRMRKRSST